MYLQAKVLFVFKFIKLFFPASFSLSSKFYTFPLKGKTEKAKKTKQTKQNNSDVKKDARLRFWSRLNKLDLLKIEASNLQEMMQFNFTVSNYLLKRSQQAMCCSCGCWLSTINSGAMMPPSGHHTASQYPYKVSRKQSWYQTLLIEWF